MFSLLVSGSLHALALLSFLFFPHSLHKFILACLPILTLHGELYLFVLHVGSVS